MVVPTVIPVPVNTVPTANVPVMVPPIVKVVKEIVEDVDDASAFSEYFPAAQLVQAAASLAPLEPTAADRPALHETQEA